MDPAIGELCKLPAHGWVSRDRREQPVGQAPRDQLEEVSYRYPFGLKSASFEGLLDIQLTTNSQFHCSDVTRWKWP